MARRTERRKRTKVGSPPGTLIHTGEQKADQVGIAVLEYDDTRAEERQTADVPPEIRMEDPNRRIWINVVGLHEIEKIERIGKRFEVHPLVLEDILNTSQRPKIERFGRYSFIVLRMLKYQEATDTVMEDQVSLILASNVLICFLERAEPLFETVRERIKNDKGYSRRQGVDYLAYMLIDVIVDHYFTVLEKMDEKIARLEEKIVSGPDPQTLERIYHVRRELIILRKSIWPLREVVGSLERDDSGLITPATRPFLRDVHDHTIRILDVVETSREMLASILEVYLAGVSHRANEIVKVLTVMATIFIPLTFIASIYGMNFEYMPELRWRWGYPLILVFMAAVGGAMLIYFKRRHWF